MVETGIAAIEFTLKLTMKTKILLVDDNRIIRHLLKLTFSDAERFEILEAENGEQALSIAKQQRPDIIILDIMLPDDFDGIQICRIIKSWNDHPQCKIILLSARGQQEDLKLGKNAGADLYITKPFSPQKLITSVDLLLAGAEST